MCVFLVSPEGCSPLRPPRGRSHWFQDVAKEMAGWVYQSQQWQEQTWRSCDGPWCCAVREQERGVMEPRKEEREKALSGNAAW